MAWIPDQVQAAVVARDVTAMVAFYRDTLELPYSEPVAIGEVARLHLFGAGTAKLKVLERLAGPPAVPAESAAEVATGATHYVTLGVDDLDAVMARVDAAGTPVLVPPTAVLPGLRMAMIADPEGNRLEIVEGLDTLGPSSPS